MNKVSRRRFVKVTATAAAGAALASQLDWASFALNYLQPVNVKNPLEFYPNRNWEEIYRNQYRFDSSFTFNCVPNDTHNCRLRAYVRNGIVARVEQAYNYEEVTDLYGNKAPATWNPRGCLKGYTIMRRLYGPHRLKYPMVRKAWKEWIEAGFPDPTKPENREKYFTRGFGDWAKITWNEAFELTAGVLLHIMDTYGGEEGAKRLGAQGYHRRMIEAMEGSGAQTIKLSPAIELCGPVSKHGSADRFANMLGLFDGKKGTRIWSEYDWYGDLDPGHAMATGIQTFDPELNDQRHSKLIVHVGKNMIENKMPDVHWIVEAIERGGKIVVVTPDYNPTASKADYWVPVRPGSDVALFLGIANVIISEKLYDVDFLRRFTDAPLLVRMDTLKYLRTSDIIPEYKPRELTGYSAKVQKIPKELREKWGDFVIWNQKSGKPEIVTRDDVGEVFSSSGVDAALEGEFTVKTVEGTEIKVKPQFQLMKELYSYYTPELVEEITTTPKELILRLARDLGTIKPACIHSGEGVNHYYHNDLKSRAFFLVLSLTGNLGKPGANCGTWAGNYKLNVIDGIGAYFAENPFEPTLDPNVDGTQVKRKKLTEDENPVYWVYGWGLPGTEMKWMEKLTGKTHTPTPTKVRWHANQNFLNNSKWLYNVVVNRDPMLEFIAVNDWEYTLTAEFADIVFPVHSWLEMTMPEITASCGNPFVEVWKGGIPPVYDTKMDSEVFAGVAKAMSNLTGDERYQNYWKFILEGRPEIYIQRVIDASTTLRGYSVEDMLKSERARLMLFRTYPRIPAWEQVNESVPFYTMTGRVENYKENDEFIREGENLIVHREPIESTPYLPNVIVAPPHDAIRPERRDIPLTANTPDEKQARNIRMTWEEAKRTENPLWKQGYRIILLTPKSRHYVHSSWAVADWNMIWNNSFGDPHRTDKRMPGVGIAEIEMNPEDAKALGIEDGDYVYVDADPADRPYEGANPNDPFYKVARLMTRAKYSPRMRPGTATIKHAPWGATPLSVRAHETRPDGLAFTEFGYQASYPYGSHQSTTRIYIKPTQMTDSLARKDVVGQEIGEGYESPVHSPSTCPKETLVKITKAEAGNWKPGKSGYSPTDENDAMKSYLKGEFIEVA